MENVISNINILFFVAALGITFAKYQKRKRYFDAGSVLLISYLFYAIMSLLLYNFPFFIFTFEPIKLFPFVYLFIMLFIAFYPVLKYDQNEITEIQQPSRFVFTVISAIFIIAALVQVPKIIMDFRVSIVELLTVSSGGQDLYNEAMDNSVSLGDGAISNLASIITNTYGNFGILLFFYYLTLENRSRLVTIGLFLSCVIGLFINVSLGQRGPIFEIILSMIITYFALKKFIAEKINKLIRKVGIVLLIIVSVPITALTISRFQDTLGAMSSVYYYTGQENLYFNNYALDNNGIRYGDRVFPMFKDMLGFDNVPKNFWERREKYPELKINDEVFVGFVGDLVMDFGPYVAPILLLLFSLYVLRKTKVMNGTILFSQLILLHFTMCLCMLGGMKLYPFADVGGNLQLIFYVLMIITFKIDYIIKYRNV